MLIFVAAGATAVSSPVRVEAASKKGFQTIGGKQYYILQSGAKMCIRDSPRTATTEPRIPLMR